MRVYEVTGTIINKAGVEQLLERGYGSLVTAEEILGEALPGWLWIEDYVKRFETTVTAKDEATAITGTLKELETVGLVFEGPFAHERGEDELMQAMGQPLLPGMEPSIRYVDRYKFYGF